MPDINVSLLRFGVFELDLRSGELRRGGVLRRLQPQPFKALAFLASRPRVPVTREELQQEIWGDDINVDFEQGLNHCIKQIRDALEDDADTPRYVETLPKLGYRFIAPVERIWAKLEPAPLPRPAPQPVPPRPEASPPREPAPPPPTPQPRPWKLYIGALAVVVVAAGAAYLACGTWPQLCPWESPRKTMLVVLPMENLGSNPMEKYDYFSDGFTEEMITQLGRLNPDRLGVLARTTSMTLKGTTKSAREIGKSLKVDYLLEGSVRRDHDHVVITAQLIQTRDDTHLWADTYDRDLADVLAIQRDVARRVADSLALELLPAQQQALAATTRINPDAFDAYQKGRYHWYGRTPDDLRQSISFYEQAIAADPNYALAYAALADSYTLLASTPYDVLPPAEAMPKAKAAAHRALQIDDNLAEAHAALAQVTFAYDWDWKTAEKEFQRALELNSGYPSAHQWYAEFLWAAGRPDEAYAQIQRAQELDPLSLVIQVSLGRHFYYQRDFNRAIKEFRDTIDMKPDFYLGHLYLALACVQAGKLDEAATESQHAVEASDSSPLSLATLAYAHARAGRRAEAMSLMNRLRHIAQTRHVPAIYLAGVHSGLGDKDQALNWLEKAYEERADYLIYLEIEPTFDPLRDDPRFRELVRRLNLPEPKTKKPD